MSRAADEDRREPIPDRAPLLGAEDARAHISLHAVLVRDDDARFDDEAVHGHSGPEAGVRWVGEEDGLEGAEHWRVVWVAVSHAADGARAYTGAVADEFWVDRRERVGRCDPARRAARKDAAVRGRVEVDALADTERHAVRRALLAQDPDAWDRAADAVQAALGPASGR